jgi:murein L,D-transpeptidase YafK
MLPHGTIVREQPPVIWPLRRSQVPIITVLSAILAYTSAVAATVSDRLLEFGSAARARMRTQFENAGIAYPPAQVKLVGLKREARMDVYAANAHGEWRLVSTYPVLAASGAEGPKLHEGDRQVPEGLYRIEVLNPNSRFHVSLRIDFPNAFDRRMAVADRRSHLGGDIMIHGSNVSVGCLAMGDRVAEELFTLVADSGLGHVDVVLAPADLRETTQIVSGKNPPWVAALYREISDELKRLPRR